MTTDRTNIWQEVIYNRFVRFLFLLFALCLVSACSLESPSFDPKATIALLTKCKDFMSFSLMILNQPDVYYNQLASRYYYALYMLGRIVSGPRWAMRGEDEGGSHNKVWSGCPESVSDLYGNDLKDLRVKCDYGVDAPDVRRSSYSQELKRIINDDEVFNTLIDNVDSICEDVSSRPNYQEQYKDLLDTIKERREQIKRKMNSFGIS